MQKIDTNKVHAAKTQTENFTAEKKFKNFRKLLNML